MKRCQRSEIFVRKRITNMAKAIFVTNLFENFVLALLVCYFQTYLPSLEELIAHHNNLTALDKDFHGLPSLCVADLSFNHIQSMNYDLVSKSRCTINGIPSTLKIYLQGMYVYCKWIV